MKTLEKKKTHIAKIRQKNQTQIDRVCQLLNWSHEDYCNHQYLEYEMFIAMACMVMPKSAILLRYSPQFRGFFNSEWMRRNDTDFIPYANSVCSEHIDIRYDGEEFSGWRIYPAVEYGDEFIIEEYLMTHSHQSLFCDADFANRYKHMITDILPYV
ncbi:MAG TPA: hypothetical protein VK541_11280 [Pedobacter sp.]|uniref:hypothetical protein n=1 Tax=Pedobacter sp. TaxID=1411316 RepID=UPI002B9881A7|nr:hypothetical protein [Pedobacter sp.]HMI03057.1 hypothetical protein [Pedobacter sp.]